MAAIEAVRLQATLVQAESGRTGTEWCAEPQEDRALLLYSAPCAEATSGNESTLQCAHENLHLMRRHSSVVNAGAHLAVYWCSVRNFCPHARAQVPYAELPNAQAWLVVRLVSSVHCYLH